jgi:hypothetical protein
MTDVPAFALGMVCLALGARACGHDDLKSRLFCAALLVGFLAFTVREYAIVAPLSVGLAGHWASRGWPRRRLPLVRDATVGIVAIAALFLAWRRGLPGSLLDSPKVPSASAATSALRNCAQSAALVGLLVSPAILLAGPRRIVRAARQRAPRASIGVALGLVLFLGAELVGQRTTGRFLGPGDYVLPNGSLGIVSLPGTRADLFPRAVFAFLAFLGIVSAVLLVLAALPGIANTSARLRRGRLGTPASPALSVVRIAAVGYGLTCTLPLLFGLPFFDRYLLPLVPLVGVLVIRAAGTAAATHRVRLVCGAALLALAIVGALYAANAASFDGTKWRVAEQAASVAGTPRRVDGGFEWNDYHAGKDVWFVAASQRRAADFCIVLRAESRVARDSRIVRAARVWGPTGGPVWIVARRQRAC